MAILFVGVLFLAAATYIVLPSSIQWSYIHWTGAFLITLKGAIPLIMAFVGFIAMLIGIADIKDKIEAKRESVEEAKSSANTSNDNDPQNAQQENRE